MITVPDSCIPSDSESNKSDTSRVLNDSILLYNAPELQAESPSGKKLRSEAELSKIATAMIELQKAEDALVKAIETVLRYTPESAPQLSRHISPNIQAWLDYSTEPSIASTSSSDLSSNQEQATAAKSAELVPFLRGKKEARKPSYKIY